MTFITNYCWHRMKNFLKDNILYLTDSILYDKKDYILNCQSLVKEESNG